MDSFILETDNTDEVLMAKNEAVMKALKVISIDAQKNAVMEVNKWVYDTPPSPNYVRTGRLRNSITSEYDGNSVQVGTNVEYAPYVELGSKFKNGTIIVPRPFIKPAIENHIKEYEEIFRRILEHA